ncbi:type I restriction enzyme S subunit [Nitrosomonas oligotropha]|uniref:Type I restriction enzyme S subunit n=1 Tax=Nitrosomonas oligotropha TaxID=42354 RepID=A0A2T5I119_9PROT|nr:restriction endonuclease subunit S [Nitrosomonas oligotropha]PTQ77519.1 type I restriction enzyme S subunit [Nitrosomonas oligotropha]
MSEWQIVKLGEVISIKGGFSYKGDHIGKGSTLLLGMGCVSFNHTFLDTGARFYGGDTPDTFLVESGDIVIATRQQSDNLPILGAPAMIPNALKGKRVIVGTNLYKLINESDIKNDYLFWLLRSPNYRNHIDSCSKGSTVKMITKDAVESFEFHCPDKVEREIISGFLWSIERKIDLLHRQNKTLEAMAETLFRQWFVEEDSDFREGCLADVAINVKEAIKASDLKSESKYIGLEHIDQRNIALKQYGFGSEVSSNKYAFQRYDILFGKLRPYFHKVCFAPFSGICSTDILVIRPIKSELFAFCLFAFFQNEVVEYANLSSGGTRMPRTDWSTLKNYPIAIPDSYSIERFNNAVSSSLKKISSNLEQIANLETLRDTLLPKLISGEVRVVV